MKIVVLLLVIALVGGRAWGHQDDFEDNDFAEFEDFDDDFVTPGAPAAQGPAVGQQQQKKEDEAVNGDFKEIDGDDADDEAVVEDEDSEFEHFQDEEEFEGFPGEQPVTDGAPLDAGKAGEPKLTMAKVPMHFRTHWDSYWMEMIMIAGLLAYFANFFMGKSKNTKLANLWLSTHRTLLEENFVLVGDDGKLENESHGLVKESESTFTLWCSGRTCCEGMLVELKMIKRQDLVAVIAGLVRPNVDQVHIKIEMSRDVMDNFVFCVATKKSATKMFKELSDLSKFCTLVSKSEDKYKVPLGFCVLSEIPEASTGILDSVLIAALNKYSALIEYIHISDQFSGVVQQEDPGNLKQPDVKRMLMAGFNMPLNVDMEVSMKPLLILIFYLMERLKRFRLSKEAKAKADKNRARVEEQFLKNTHAARAEAAAQRREDKRKQEKERVMAEDDPEKQRRWEKKEQKRQAKKKAPKMKQLSIKAL